MSLPPTNASSSLSLPANSYSSKFHNPNRRSSEVTDPIRRSFSENPFTKNSTCPSPRRFGPSAPPNTSKDYPTRRRDSISCPRECEEKENRTNTGSSKLHCRPRSVSPSTRIMIPPSASNSRKNFMSPTISAASKIGASPRKKILSESNNYNQPLQSSVTCSDLRSSSSSVRSLCGTFAEQMEADHRDYLAQRKECLSFSKQIEEKESKRDLNSKQIQVKLLPVSRNTKHFMSPTVSAASKISASPRKKILTESNGGQISVRHSDSRTSCSSLNNITVDFATKLHDPKGPVSKKNVTFDPTVRIIPPVESDPLQENGSVRDDELLNLECSSVNNLSESMESSETKTERENGHRASDSDEITCDSSFDTSSKKERENVEGEGVLNNVSPNLNSLIPVLPPLDTDQLILELSSDPKTNSLAPGITDYCEGEINHNPLEDGFIFDIFPDTEGTIESDFEKLHSENENLDSKEKELIRGKESLSQHFLTSPKWIFLIFIIFCGFSVINPQVRSYSLIRGSGFSMVSEYKAAGYLEGGKHLKHWGNDLIASLFGCMSNIKVGHEWGYICFQNLTASDGTWCFDKENGYLELTSDDSSYMLTNFETFEHNVQSGEEDVECEENLYKDESEIANETADESCVIEANVDQEVAGEAYKSEGASQGVSSAEVGNIQYEHGLYTAEWGTENNQVITDPTSEKNEILQPAELQPVLDQVESGQEYTNVGSESKAFTLVEENLDYKSDLAQTETMNEMVMDSMNGKGEAPRTSGNDAEIPKADNMFSVISDSTDGSVVQAVMNISLLVLSFAVATTLVCGIRKSSTKVSTASEEQDQEVKLFKNLDTSSVSAKLLVEISDVEVSCSTAISSYQKDSLDRKCSTEATDEVQSQQKRRSKKNLMRESLASSSDLSNTSLSLSYGSFTTYGMIPSRYRDGDEEMLVTPIRRSSRLRKQ